MSEGVGKPARREWDRGRVPVRRPSCKIFLFL